MLIVQSAAEPAAIRNAIVDLIAPIPISMQVAAAYVSRGGSDILLDALVNAAGQAAFTAMPKVLITSFDFGLTEPQALRRWQALPNTEVRVSGAQRLLQGSLLPARAFHPKLYAFSTDAQHCNALIGSANLTSRGFSVNTEAAWAQRDIPRGQIDAAFTSAGFETVPLTEALLAAYEGLRVVQPPPPEIQQEAEPVARPAPPVAAATQLFRLAIENGAINPANFNAMWVQGEALQGGSRNQRCATIAVSMPQGTVTAEKADCPLPRKGDASSRSLRLITRMSKRSQTANGSIGAVGSKPICPRIFTAMRLACVLNPRRNPNSTSPELVISTDDDVFDDLGVLLR